jgi:tetratricopeptide (TPR) repeat protein
MAVAKEAKKTKKIHVRNTLFGIPVTQMGPILAFLGTLLYLQTTTFEYTQDDAIVINDNMFTTAGVKGIAGLFKYDTFYGYFKDQSKTRLVSGGRYRPLTPAMFAIEYAIAGPNPWLSHFISAVCYGFLCWILFGFLLELLTPRLSGETALQVALFSTLIFALHPIHTEAVANIKGRDEIVAAMGAIGGLWLMLLSTHHSKANLMRALAALSFFLGLLAKENIITMLAVAPVTLWWYQKNTPVKWISNLWPVIIASFIFILLRGVVTGLDASEAPKELMNNPFLKVENNSYIPFTLEEKSATIVYTMGKYVQLLVFPYPLTHDYYPRHIEIQHWNKPLVILSIIFWLGLLYVVIKGWKARTWWAYGIIFYVCTMSITSNIVFPIGTNMSERFAFLPSIGFAIIAGYAISLGLNSSNRKAVLGIAFALCLALGGWTLVRSRVWKDNSTLFTTDIKTSGRSAKLLNAVGGDLITRAEDEKDELIKKQMLTDAQGYLKRALEIHPNYKLGYLLLGNSYFHLGDLDQAIMYFRHVLKMDPNYAEGKRNLGVALRDQGKIQGEKNNNLAGAITLLQEAVQYLPNDYETYQLLGVAHGQAGDTQKAIEYFRKEIELAPKNATAHFNLGIALRQAGDAEGAAASFETAKTLDPNLPQFKNR